MMATANNVLVLLTAVLHCELWLEKQVSRPPRTQISTYLDEIWQESVTVWNALVGSIYPDRNRRRRKSFIFIQHSISI